MAWGYCGDCHRWSFELVSETRRCPVCDEFHYKLGSHWTNERMRKFVDNVKTADPVDQVLQLNLQDKRGDG